MDVQLISTWIENYEFYFSILLLILFTLYLWLISKGSEFKKQDIKTAFIVALIIAGGSMLLKFIIGKSSFLTTLLIAIISVKYVYKEKWRSSILTGIAVYALTVITFTIIFFGIFYLIK